MKRLLITAATTAAVAACASNTATAPQAPVAKAPTSTMPSGIELANFDRTVKPQDDFYRWVNGTWLETKEIPADKSNYGSFTKLHDEAQVQLRTIIEESAAAKAAEGTDEQKVGDFYASFMNVEQVNTLGAKPLKADLARIDAMTSTADIAALHGYLARINVDSIFGSFVYQDAKQPDVYTIYFSQGGLGLPDRDYYLDADNEKFASIRKAYVAHIEKMLTMAGVANAAAGAKKIMALETKMAEAHWTKVDSRNISKTYNKYALADLEALTPNFSWPAMFTTAGIDTSTFDSIIVSQPSTFTAMSDLIGSVPLSTWKTYYKWHMISDAAPFLSQEFVAENFAFYGSTLRGTPENQPRWKRGVQAVEGSLGEVLGRIYVKRHFPPAAKARMEVLVNNLNKAYEQSIKELDWMTPATKEKALEKLSKFTTKIGYPDEWKDYSALTVEADDLYGNMKRSAMVETQRQIDKLGGPIDKGEWFMTPQTVNAYYNPVANEIVFPAAILQPPFFDFEADPAVNYGGIGAVIGHEIGHGFDDQGSKFDGDGVLSNWWTDEDRAAFDKLGKQLVEQYNAYEPLDGYTVNGELTLGENIGDLGGITIAYEAYKLSLEGQPAPVIDGFTGTQRVMIGWAQVWRRLYREEALIERVKTDPHSPSEFRANGALVNMPAFHEAFNTKPGDAMWKAPEERVQIW